MSIGAAVVVILIAIAFSTLSIIWTLDRAVRLIRRTNGSDQL